MEQAAGSVSRRRSETTVTRFSVAITLLPFVVGAFVMIFVVRGSYLPISDHALTEMHVRDVGHHPVLTGLYSRDDWSHPGPMLFYVLAPFYWLTGGSSIALNLGALAINAASIGGMAFLARRRGGTTLLLCTFLACALLMRTLGPDFLRDPWNTYVTVLPFGLLVFLVWSMICGELWATPAAVVVASFLAQTHVGFVVLALPLLAFGAVWQVVMTLRGSDAAARKQLGRIGISSVVLGLILWLPVMIDVVIHHPNNATRIVRWFRHPDEGIHTISEGWRVMTGQFAAIPEWLTTKRAPLRFSGESSFLHQSPLPLLLLFVILAGVGFRRMQQADGLRLLAAFAVTLVLGIFAIARTVGLAFDYRLRWTWVIGMIGFIAILWCAALAIKDIKPSLTNRVVVGIALAAISVCSFVNVATAATAGVPQKADTKVLAALMPDVLHALENNRESKHGQVVVDDGPFQLSSWYSRSLVLQLERHGYDARMPPPRGLIVGEHRQQDADPVAVHLVVASDAEIDARDADPTLHLIAKWSSVTFDQQVAYKRAVAAIDDDFANGRIDLEQHALELSQIDLGTYDPAVSWAVAVYEAAAPG